MATTISGTNGVSQVQDGIVTDGKLDLTANSAEVKEALNASGTAPIYACRAWVNFDGTGTVGIRASGNVSSITDNGTGDYTVNFATAMQDANYSTSLNASILNSGRTTFSLGDATGGIYAARPPSILAGQVTVYTYDYSMDRMRDADNCHVAIFR